MKSVLKGDATTIPFKDRCVMGANKDLGVKKRGRKLRGMTNVSFLPLTRVKRRQSKGGGQKKATINEEEGRHTAEHCGRCLISQKVSRRKKKRTRIILTLILALIFGIGATSELRFLWATPDAFIPLFPYLGCSSNSVWKGGKR